MSFDLHVHAHTDVAQDLMPTRPGPLGGPVRLHTTRPISLTYCTNAQHFPSSFPHNLLTHSLLPPSFLLKSRLLLGLRVRPPPSSHAASPSVHTCSILAGSLPTFPLPALPSLSSPSERNTRRSVAARATRNYQLATRPLSAALGMLLPRSSWSTSVPLMTGLYSIV